MGFNCIFHHTGPIDNRVLALLVVVGLSGCRGKTEWPMPQTYPVAGKVVVSQGQVPPAGAMIQFVPNDMELSASGRIEADGRFALSVLYKGQTLSGATAGPHHVTVLGSRPKSIELLRMDVKESYTVEPKENYFVVKLDIPPRG